MRFTILVSKKDIAGLNVKDRLTEKNISKINDAELLVIDKDSVDFNQELEFGIIIFATRHQSKSGEKTLSVHFPGNFDIAEFGGKDKGLCMSAPIAAKQAFQILYRKGKDSGYEITMEATHHGPYIRKPCFFIEIGSKKEQWQDITAGNIIADTILELIKNYEQKKQDIAIGFGGTHYCNNFNKIQLDTEVALSHICPKHNIKNIDEAMVLKMINSTQGRVSYALLDWKGLKGQQKQKLKDIFEKIRLPWKKTKDI